MGIVLGDYYRHNDLRSLLALYQAENLIDSVIVPGYSVIVPGYGGHDEIVDVIPYSSLELCLEAYAREKATNWQRMKRALWR